jgi:glutathione S-transferase
MTAKLHLFTSPSAFPNPQRLRLFMHEKGIADLFEETIL